MRRAVIKTSLKNVSARPTRIINVIAFCAIRRCQTFDREKQRKAAPPRSPSPHLCTIIKSHQWNQLEECFSHENAKNSFHHRLGLRSKRARFKMLINPHSLCERRKSRNFQSSRLLAESFAVWRDSRSSSEATQILRVCGKRREVIHLLRNFSGSALINRLRLIVKPFPKQITFLFFDWCFGFFFDGKHPCDVYILFLKTELAGHRPACGRLKFFITFSCIFNKGEKKKIIVINNKVYCLIKYLAKQSHEKAHNFFLLSIARP